MKKYNTVLQNQNERCCTYLLQSFRTQHCVHTTLFSLLLFLSTGFDKLKIMFTQQQARTTLNKQIRWKDHQTNRKKASGRWEMAINEELNQSCCCSVLRVGYILIIRNTDLFMCNHSISYTNHLHLGHEHQSEFPQAKCS